ncbi:MAG: TetR/AcrR family transcriptional regulator [Acidimicrobiales bacterium]
MTVRTPTPRAGEVGTRALLDGLPPRPPRTLDPTLDAVERCLARYGLHRTSMTDIARELNIARTTLYRQLSSVEEAVALVASRQLHRFLDDLAARLLRPGAVVADAFIGAVASAVREARSHPVTLRVLEDEPEIVGTLVTRDLQSWASQIADVLTPMLDTAMKAGTIRRADPAIAAQWLVRVVAALVVLPPAGDLDAALLYGLRPLLAPD